MSLQDDYFDLSADLKGWQKNAFDRIWEAFCDCERENERLSPIVGNMRDAISRMFEDLTNA